MKKTRPEKNEKHQGGNGGLGFQLPSDGGSSASANPYLVKPEPKKPPASAYQVRAEPERPPASAYQVKREPDKPRLGGGRPLTPGGSKQRPGQVSQVSPIHSNRNSPVRPGGKPRGLSESSDSNSSDSSDSDSDSDSNDSSTEKSMDTFRIV